MAKISIKVSDDGNSILITDLKGTIHQFAINSMDASYIPSTGIISLNAGGSSISGNYKYSDVENGETGNTFASLDALEAYVTTNFFREPGGDAGDGVQSVTGNLVDNSDPNNPVVNTSILSLSYEATGSEGTLITLVSGITGAVTPIILVTPANTNAILAGITTGWSYNSATGHITFDASFLTPSETYLYTVLIKI